MRPCLVLALLSMSGCAGSRPPSAAPRPIASEPRTEQVARASEPAPDPCAGREGLMIDPIAPIAADWQGAVTIGGRGEATVRWCGGGTVSIVSLALGPRDAQGELAAARYVRNPDPARARLTHGAALTEELWAPAAPGPLVLVVEATTDRAQPLTARVELESVDDPERVALRTDCEAAGGTWAPHGMAGHESCDRPTRDAGQRCTSDVDCEGPCLDAGSEPLGDPPPPGIDVPTCGPGRQPHLLVGRCHDRSLRFGCHARLSEVTIECISPAFARRAHTVCVD